MKFKNKLKSILGVSMILLASSCETFLDVNTNPNNPTDAPISGLMTNITYQTTLNVYRQGRTAAFYVQYLASPNPSSSSDTMEREDFSTMWFNLYNAMTDVNEMILKSQESGAKHYLGAGQVMMALNLAMTVDFFGDVPYSESFNFTTVTPSYDDDMTLYQSIDALLTEGIANLNAESTSTIGLDDFIFKGDIGKWKKFAYTLKARYLIHTKGDAGYSDAAVLSAIDNGFASNEDNAQIFFFEQDRNPWANVARNNANLLLDGWISEQFVEALDGTSYPTIDPRMPLLIGTTDDGEFLGTVNGAGRGNAPEEGARSTLIQEQYYTSTESPLLISTYAELKFIEAEAALASNKDRAYAAYLAGISAHMDMLSVETAKKAAYLADPSVSMGAAALSIDDIFKEKYVALFLHPETWNDARRYDYAYKNMNLPDNLNPNLSGQFIRRVAYPDSEVSRNGKNIPSVTLLDRIWWDQ
jgi:hypothetical protein